MPAAALGSDDETLSDESANPIELVDRRTATSEVFQNPDGTLTLKEFAAPVHVRQGGQWVDVDYDLVKQADGSYAPKAAPADIVVGGGGSKQATEITFDDGKSVGLSWPTTLPEPAIDGGVATYKLSKSTDLVVAITGTGVATRIRLNEAPSSSDPIWKLGLRSDSVDVEQVAPDSLEFNDSDGKALGETTAMVAWDSSADEGGDPDNVVPVEADLSTPSTTGDVTKQDLKLTAPEGFLNDPSTQYPVTIDPDINAVSSPRSTWMRKDTSASTPNAAGQYHRLLIGRVPLSSNTNPAMAYLGWSNAQLAGKDVISAEVGVYQYDAGACAARALNAHPLAGNFSNTTEYTNRPDANLGTGDSIAISTNPGSDNSGCTSANAWVKMNVTKMAKSWATGRYANYGMRLNVPTDYQADSSYSRSVCSGKPDSSSVCSTTSTVPYLKVRYNGPPNTAALPTTPVTTVNGVVTSSSTKPTWTTSATDAEQSAVKYDIQVHSSTAGTAASLVASCATAQVTSGASSSCTPTTALVSGNTYYARAKATDSGGLSGAWSGYRTVKIQAASLTISDVTINDCVDCGTEDAAVSVKTPTFGATPEASAGGSVRTDFDVRQLDENENLVSVASGSTTGPTGTKVTWTSNELEDGDYVVRARAFANGAYSAWSADEELAVTVLDGMEPDLTSLRPNPDLETIFEDEVTGDTAAVQFDLPVDGQFDLAATGGGDVTMERGGVDVGVYAPNAVDSNGEVVPTTLRVVGDQIVQTIAPTATTEFPVVLQPTFQASDPTLPEVQEIYPPASEVPLMADPEELASTDPGDLETAATQRSFAATDATDPSAESVDLVDESMTEFVADLQTLEDAPAPAAGARAVSSQGYVPVPKGSGKFRHYYYDPKLKHPRPGRVWRKPWHDYCSSGGPDQMNFGSSRVSFKGPCARHDLCIEFKMAEHRDYCDKWLKLAIRANCYAIIGGAPSDRPRLTKCQKRASTFFKAVQKFGTDPNRKKWKGAWGHRGTDYHATQSAAPSKW